MQYIVFICNIVLLLSECICVMNNIDNKDVVTIYSFEIGNLVDFCLIATKILKRRSPIVGLYTYV